MKKSTPSCKVVLGKDGGQKLASWNSIKNKITVQNVRDEKEYLDHIGHIIQRDYFPDLARVKGEYGPLSSTVGDTPSSVFSSSSRNPEKVPERVSLDKYLANNTTEDNASFSRIMDEAKMNHESKMSQFFAPRESSLALPSTENLLALEAPKYGALKKFNDKAPEEKTVLTLVAPSSSLVSHNSVHFVPDGTALTLDELTDKANKERSIDSSNTRFKRPLPVADKKRLKYLAQNKVVRYGADGKEINPLDSLGKETPNVGGFRFVPGSPSASEIAGGSDTPLMTWGQLENTPQRISTDDEDTGHYTPYTATGRVAFHMPSPSHREELAYKLADSAGKRRAQDRQKQIDKAKAGFLSPAARRLLSSSSSSSKGINSPLLNLPMKHSPRVASVKNSSSLSSLHYQSPLLAKKAKGLGILAKTPQRENPPADVTADLLNLSTNNR